MSFNVNTLVVWQVTTMLEYIEWWLLPIDMKEWAVDVKDAVLSSPSATDSTELQLLRKFFSEDATQALERDLQRARHNSQMVAVQLSRAFTA